jgi:hypothetical protein
LAPFGRAPHGKTRPPAWSAGQRTGTAISRLILKRPSFCGVTRAVGLPRRRRASGRSPVAGTARTRSRRAGQTRVPRLGEPADRVSPRIASGPGAERSTRSLPVLAIVRSGRLASRSCGKLPRCPDLRAPFRCRERGASSNVTAEARAVGRPTWQALGELRRFPQSPCCSSPVQPRSRPAAVPSPASWQARQTRRSHDGHSWLAALAGPTLLYHESSMVFPPSSMVVLGDLAHEARGLPVAYENAPKLAEGGRIPPVTIWLALGRLSCPTSGPAARKRQCSRDSRGSRRPTAPPRC